MDDDYYDDFEEFEEGYGFGDDDLEFEEGAGYADEPEETQEYEEEYDFVMGARDYDRVGGGGSMVQLAGKRYLDPKDRALAEFRSNFKKCTNDSVDINTAEEKIKKGKGIVNRNMELLSIAACFRMRYSKLDDESITKFISKNIMASQHNPIDIIRYIRYYDAL